jgi:hypothetical protein
MDEDLSDEPLEPWLPEWIEAAAEEAHTVPLGMLREKGRGADLVGVARVDAALETLLKAALEPPRSRETLFHPERPLGSFGVKVALAARLGLIVAAVEQSLHSLRRIRNAFTHSTTVVRLADAPFRDQLEESCRQARENPLWQPMQTTLDNHIATEGESSSQDDPGLQDYILLITILVAFLETAARVVAPIQPSVGLGFSGIKPALIDADDHS